MKKYIDADILRAYMKTFLTGNDLSTPNEIDGFVENLPAADVVEAQHGRCEWNNHTVACLLAELFDDTCACNFSAIQEWLPGKCELLAACPNPGGVACWEQYLKHRKEVQG